MYIYTKGVTGVVQAFRFMVGPDHCPMISKYGSSLSKAVGPVDPSFSVVKNSFFSFFLSLYTARTSFEYYRQMYFVHSGLQDESLQVTISKLPQGSLTCTGGDFPCTGDIQLTSRSEGRCTYLASSLQMTLEKACLTLTLIKNIHLIASLQTPQNRKYM